MNTPSSGPYASSALAALVILAGCTNSGSLLAPWSPTHASDSNPTSNTRRAGLVMVDLKTQRLDHGKSWMSPSAKKSALLYVSDAGSGDVYVYSYPKGKLTGTLTGFNFPEGECADKA